MAFKQALPVYIPEEQPKPKIYRQTKKEKKQIKIESKNTIKQPLPNIIKEDIVFKLSKEECELKRLNKLIKEDKKQINVTKTEEKRQHNIFTEESYADKETYNFTKDANGFVKVFKKFDKRLFKEALNGTFKEVTIKNPNFNTFEIDDEGNERKGVNWDLVNQTVEIYLNNELINKDIKHNLLTNLIICVNMQNEIKKDEYLVGRQHSPNEYFSEIIEGKLMYFKIVKFYYH